MKLFIVFGLCGILICCKNKSEQFKYIDEGIQIKDSSVLSNLSKSSLCDSVQIQLENVVISALIRSEFKTKSNYYSYYPNGKIKKVKIKTDIVLVEETKYSSLSPFNLKYSKFNNLDTLAYYDFSNKKSSTIKIDSIRDSNLKITYISERELYSMFKPSKLKGWSKYDSLYGFTPCVRVSRVGLNKTNDKAFVFYRSTKGLMAGISYYVMLEKIKGEWVVKEKVIASQS